MPREYLLSDEGLAPQEYGQAVNRISVVTLALDTARDDERLEIGGSFLWAVNASSIDATVSVRFQDEFYGLVPFRRGTSVRGVRFSRLYITHAAQAGETITLAYATEEQDNIQIENPALFGAQIDSVSLLSQDTSWRYDADNGKAFHAAVILSALAANYNYASLSNPNGSGVVLYLLHITNQFTATGPNLGKLSVISAAYSDAFTERPMSIGGAAGSGVINTQQSTTLNLNESYAINRRWTAQYDKVEIWDYRKRGPIRIPENTQIGFWQNTVNVDMAPTFEWIEV